MDLDVHTTARERLVSELREHALVIGEVVLTSGKTAEYLVDAKRAILRPAGFMALAELVAAQAQEWDATAVGGMTMGADPIACAALAGGADVKAFFVRKEVKQHGLSRRIEGPLLDSTDRCMLVEDVTTTGGSTIRALEAVRDEGHRYAACWSSAIAWRAAPRRSSRLSGCRSSRLRRSTTCIRSGRTASGVSACRPSTFGYENARPTQPAQCGSAPQAGVR